MEFLNKAIAQLTDLFRSMTPGARITSALLLIVLVVSLGYMFQHQSTAPDDYLFGGDPLPAALIPAMEQAFAKAELNTYSVEGTRIRVPQSQRSKYMAALFDAKVLPPNFGSALSRAIGDTGIFESPKQSKLREMAAKQEELQLIISRMAGIENASVIIDMENSEVFNQPKVKTASVSVKPIGSAPLEPAQAGNIRYCVAKAVAGMNPNDVAVTDLNSNMCYHGDVDSATGGGQNAYAAAMLEYEGLLKKKILAALAFIPNVTVTATVVLNPEKSLNSVELDNGPKTVTMRQTDKSRTNSREGGNSPGGQPGLASQQQRPNTPAAVGSAKNTEQNDEQETQTVNELAKRTQTVKETAGLTPRIAKVSVNIPPSYFEKVWLEKNPTKPGEEAKKPDQASLDTIATEYIALVRKYVAPLLPPSEGISDPMEQVTVTTLQDVKHAEIPAPAITQKAMGWLSDNWRTLGLGGLVLVSLMMVRGMVRSVPEPEPVAMSARVSEPESEAEPGETSESTTARRLRRISAGGPSLRDELSDLVKEDPDSAANILRTWIGSAG